MKPPRKCSVMIDRLLSITIIRGDEGNCDDDEDDGNDDDDDSLQI